MPPCKPFLTLDQLCSLAIDDRGLICADRALFAKYLLRTNYYRFSGYAREFQIDPKYGDNHFKRGITFEAIREIIDADSMMRFFLMEQISTVEIAVRSTLAHEYARAYGERAFYLNTDFYKQGGNSSDDKPFDIVKGLLSDLERDKSRMVSRYVNESIVGETFEDRCKRYANVPIWVAVEVVSFGRVSNILGFSKDSLPAKEAAKSLGVQWDPFAEVVHALSVMRNMCAHHRQLWNRRMAIHCPVQKKLKPRNVKYDELGPYPQLIMANYYRSKIDGDTSVAKKMNELLASHPGYSEGFRNPCPK